MKTFLLSAVASGIALSGMAFADDHDRVWFGGFAEHYYADKNKFSMPTLDRVDWGYGIEFGKFLDENWAFRAELAHIGLDAYDSEPDIDGNRYGLDAMYFPRGGQTYVFTGVKYQSLHEDFSMMNIGLGRHWTLNDKWKLITEAAMYHDFGQSYQDYSFKLGLAYTPFGGETVEQPKALDSDKDGVFDQQDMCPSTPMGYAVDARGCALDSDKDGVADAADKCPSTPMGTRVDASGCAVSTDDDNDGIRNEIDQCANTPASHKVDSKGCTMFTDTQDSVNLRILFANNSSIIENPNHPDFANFADFMKRYPEVNAEIEGHSSKVGAAAYNMTLSQRRADAAKQLLITKYGVDGDRLTARGYGETQLLDDGDSAEAHKMNRRISARISVTEQKPVTE